MEKHRITHRFSELEKQHSAHAKEELIIFYHNDPGLTFWLKIIRSVLGKDQVRTCSSTSPDTIMELFWSKRGISEPKF